jgi:hypothetical protein
MSAGWEGKKCTKKLGGGASWEGISKLEETSRLLYVCVFETMTGSHGASLGYLLDDCRYWRPVGH